MPTLILKIRMNSDEVVEAKGEIYRALRVLVGYSHVDIKGHEFLALMDEALELRGSMVGGSYDIVED